MRTHFAPLRVLFVVDRCGVAGGAERFVSGLAMHMPRDRVEPIVCSTRRADQQTLRLLEEHGIAHIELGRSAKWDVHRVLRLGRVIRDHHVDVLHAHKFGSNVWGTLLGRACRVPVVLAQEHNWAYSGKPLRVWLDRNVIGRLAARFIAVSAASREKMITHERIGAQKIVVMPTAYIPHPVQAPSNIRAELRLDERARIIAVAAGLREEKALDVMIDAFSTVHRRIEDVHLVIAGDGPLLDELEQQVDLLGLRGHVHFLGRRADVDSILRAADAGAMSSDWEGMPLFVFECMAAGTPLVATAVGGLPEVVVQGVSGVLVPPQDRDALVDALIGVLADQDRATSLARAASERLPQFTIDQVARLFADLYEELMAEARGK